MDTILDFQLGGLTEEDFRNQSSRQEWAEVLGVSERTLCNWENKILDTERAKKEKKVLPVYYWLNRRTANGEPKKNLDFYQKTILFLIARLKSGGMKENREVESWFDDMTVGEDGNPVRRIILVSRNKIKQVLQA